MNNIEKIIIAFFIIIFSAALILYLKELISLRLFVMFSVLSIAMIFLQKYNEMARKKQK